MKYNPIVMTEIVDVEKLLSVAKAAARLGLHRTRINQLIDSGDLPATMIGGRYVIHEDDLERVKERRPPGRPPRSQVEEKAKSKKPRSRTKKGPNRT
jgi:excisionase family DNA binding protein